MDFTRTPEDNTSVIKMMDGFYSFIGQKPVSQRPIKKRNNSQTSCSFHSDISLSDLVGQQKCSIDTDYTTLTRNEKADLIVARSKIAKFEDEVHGMKNEKQQLELELDKLKRRNSSSLLKEQEDSDSIWRQFKNVLEQMQTLEDERQELTKKYEELKNTYASSLKNWNKEKEELHIQLNQIKTKFQTELKDMREHDIRQRDQLDSYKSKCEEMDLQLKAIQNWRKEKMQLLSDFSDAKLRYDLAENKIKELEEKASRFSESSSFLQNNQTEFAKFRELIKENQKLKEDNKLYRESAENALILQEKINTLEGKLKRAEQIIDNQNEMELENKSLKSEIQKWESSDVFGEAPKARSPLELARIIAELQQNQLSMVVKQGELEASVIIKDSLLASKIEECLRLHDVSTELQSKNEQLEDKCHKLQRRFTLISSDRDGLRRVLASYENDDRSPSKIRIQEAENTIQTNFKQISQLEDELITAKREASVHKTLYLQLQLEYEKLKSASLESPQIVMERQRTQEANKQVEELKVKIQKLQEEKQLLEISLKKKKCQGDYDPLKSRILHLPNNPIQIAREKYLFDLENVREENEILRKKLLQLQAQNSEMMDDSMNVSKLIKTSKTMNEVKKQLEAEIKSKKRLTEQYGKKAKDYREAVYNLLGYSFKETLQDTYRVQSIYSVKQDDFFLFKCAKGKDGNCEINMIETKYSREWLSSINDYLQRGHSIPGFLATVTLELFSQSTEIRDSTLGDKAKQLK